MNKLSFILIGILFAGIFLVSISEVEATHTRTHPEELEIESFTVSGGVGEFFYAVGYVEEYFGPTQQVEIKVCEVEYDKCTDNYDLFRVDVDPDTLFFALRMPEMPIIDDYGTYGVIATYSNAKGDRHHYASEILEITEYPTLPVERVIMKNPRIVDPKDNTLFLDEIRIFDKIAFAADLQQIDYDDITLPTKFFVEVINDVGTTIFKGSTDELDSGWRIHEDFVGVPFDEIPKSAIYPITITATVLWTPETTGTFKALVHVREAIGSGSLLTSVTPIEFEVLLPLESICGEGTAYIEGQCVPICGEGTIFQDGKCVLEEPTLVEEPDIEGDDKQKLEPERETMTTEMQQKSSNGGGCLIATATFGSELAPQVQQLREIRDNFLLQTESGRTFMESFNQFYYSFSPSIADLERENPIFKEAVKLTITPLLSSLSLLNYVDMDSEIEVLGYGISLILLNVGMYFVAPAMIILAIYRKHKPRYDMI
ncbi:MAG: hypothetical protein NPMRTH1_50013 [Nitrosopumilales archaeon]|nr:MAG: hypothetical protein NPMRTH1_50013 [Nitrosopumilales archaeon]